MAGSGMREPYRSSPRTCWCRFRSQGTALQWEQLPKLQRSGLVWEWGSLSPQIFNSWETHQRAKLEEGIPPPTTARNQALPTHCSHGNLFLMLLRVSLPHSLYW